VIEVRTTEKFEAGFAALRDRRARLQIQVRIDRLGLGNPAGTARSPREYSK